MPDFSNHLLSLLLTSLILGLITSLVAIPVCKPLKLIDNPGAEPHKQHARPTPLAGGLVIGMSMIVLFFIFPNLLSGKMKWAVISAIIILIFGLWDDHSGLNAKYKFIGQGLAAIISIWGGIKIEILSEFILPGNQALLNILNNSLTFFWLVGITNAFNLIDSMDGIVAGLSTLAGAFFIFLTSTSGQPDLAIWASVLTGISISLYFWNTPPAKYFLGDSGAQTLGFFLAILAILYNPVNKDQASSWFTPILLLSVPIFDTSLVVFSRLRRHRPPFEGNRDHTYHRLVRAGLNSARAVGLVHIVALTMDIIAVYAFSQPPIIANTIFAGCMIIGATIIYIFDFSPTYITPKSH